MINYPLPPSLSLSLSLYLQVCYKLETQQQIDLKKEQLLDQQQRVRRIAREMSDLVVYCRPVPFLLEGMSGISLIK